MRNFLSLMWVVLLTLTTHFPSHFLAGSAYAQGSEGWSAWLYNVTTGTMTRVSPAGELEAFLLPLPANYDTRPNGDNGSVAVSPDGTRMAYAVRSSVTNDLALVIYDHALGVITATYAPGKLSFVGLDFNTRFQFSPDGTALAFSYTFDEDKTWEIVVIDLAAMSLRAAMRGGDATTSGVTKPTGYPVIQYFRPDGQIAFFLSEDPFWPTAQPPTFLWNPANNTLAATTGYNAPWLDIFPPTGEVVFSQPDERLPILADVYPYGHFNSLHVYIPATDQRFPFYAVGDRSVSSPHFVENGTQVIAKTSDPEGTVGALLLIGRDGTLRGTLPITPVLTKDIAGTPEGFIYISSEDTPAYSLKAVNLRDATLGDVQTIWSVAAPQEQLRLAWVGQFGELVFLFAGSFEGWTPLIQAETDITTAPIVQATPTPAVLRVGGTATVRTTEGDSLNLRSDAGTVYAIREKLERGTLVHLLDGPRNADGFVWWKVRAPSGIEGWVVEYADNEVTLVPGTSPGFGDEGEIDEAAEGSGDGNLPSLIKVGQEATISLSGRRDTLRLRNAPGLEARVVTQLPNGTRVRVLDGPQRVDDFIWWQVRTPEGNVGWVAEIVGGERTLTPLQ